MSKLLETNGSNIWSSADVQHLDRALGELKRSFASQVTIALCTCVMKLCYLVCSLVMTGCYSAILVVWIHCWVFLCYITLSCHLSNVYLFHISEFHGNSRFMNSPTNFSDHFVLHQLSWVWFVEELLRTPRNLYCAVCLFLSLTYCATT